VCSEHCLAEHGLSWACAGLIIGGSSHGLLLSLGLLAMGFPGHDLGESGHCLCLLCLGLVWALLCYSLNGLSLHGLCWTGHELVWTGHWFVWADHGFPWPGLVFVCSGLGWSYVALIWPWIELGWLRTRLGMG
jgi:hypothetical protein